MLDNVCKYLCSPTCISAAGIIILLVVISVATIHAVFFSVNLNEGAKFLCRIVQTLDWPFGILATHHASTAWITNNTTPINNMR